jgi:CRP-like cAMP-binding protein
VNTFEKMLFLKSMPLFKYVKNDALLEVASVLEEQTVKAGESFIQKGEFGTTMYMIVTGKVKVHDGDELLKELGDHEVVGELAALSPAKRIASVTALEETLLLKISSNTIYDLMEIQTELAKGIIQVLCQRERSIASDFDKAITLHI